jgi:hypothetical protein
VFCIAGRISGNEGSITSDVAPHPRRTWTPCIWLLVDGTYFVPVEFLCWVCGKFFRVATLPLRVNSYSFLYVLSFLWLLSRGSRKSSPSFIFRSDNTRRLCLTLENQFNCLSYFILWICFNATTSTALYSIFMSFPCCFCFYDIVCSIINFELIPDVFFCSSVWNPLLRKLPYFRVDYSFFGGLIEL